MRKLKMLLMVTIIGFLALFSLVSCKNKDDIAGVQYVSDYIKEIYKDDYLTAETSVTADFDRPTFMLYEEVTYQIEWSIVISSGDSTAVSIVDKSETLKTIRVNAFIEDETKFVLTATIKGVDEKNYLTLTANYVIPSAGDLLTYSEWMAKANEESVFIKGIVTGKETFNAEFNNTSVYLADESGTGGYLAYRIACTQDQYNNDFAIGNTLIVVGKKTSYNGLLELAAGASYKVVATGANVTANDITSEITSSAAPDLTANLVSYQGRFVTFTGEITSVTVSSSRTICTVKVGANYIDYAISTYFMAATSTEFTTLAGNSLVGATATFTGVMGWSSSNKAQPTAISSTGIVLNTEINLLKRILTSNEIVSGFTAYYDSVSEKNLPAVGVTYSEVALTYQISAIDAKSEINTTAAVYNTETHTLVITPGDETVFVTLTISSVYLDSNNNNAEQTYTREVKFTIIGTNPTVTPITGVTSTVENGTILVVEGWIDAVTSEKYGNMNIKDIDGNSLVIYGLYDISNVRYDSWAAENKLAAGQYVRLIGPKGVYGTTIEIINAVFISKDDSMIIKSVTESLALADSENEILITGKVGEITNTTTGVFTLIDLTNSENSILVNGLTDSTKVAGTFSQLSVKTDMIIIIKGSKTTVETVAQITGAYALYVPESLALYESGFGVGFEASEGFTTASVYNLPAKKYGSDKQWIIYYGTVTTTGKITDLTSLQMRWYTSAVDNLGYAYTYYKLDNLASVSFTANDTLGALVAVSISTDDGATWTNSETFNLTTTATAYTYTLAATTNDVMVKFALVLPATTPTGTARVTIDAITFNAAIS